MIRYRAARLLTGETAAGLAMAAVLMAAPAPVPAAESAAPPVVNWSDPAKAGDVQEEKTATKKTETGKTGKSGTTASAKDASAAADKDKPAKTDKGKAEKVDATEAAPAAAADKTEKAGKTDKADKPDESDKSGEEKGKTGKKAATLAKAIVIGRFDSWEAAYFDDHGNKVCYMATAPVSTSSSAPVHGRDKNVMLFITHWPADNEKNAVTVAAGYSYKEGTKAIVNIGTESYALETGGPGTGADPDMSWMKDDSQDDALTKAIQKGDELTVRGTSKRGTTITDTYSLKGSADAYKAITKTCGY